MNDVHTSVLTWLADYLLLTTVLSAVTLVMLVVIKQPAQRLVVTKSTLVAFLLLAVLCALPGWSLVHLLAREEPLPHIPPIAIDVSPAPNESAMAATEPLELLQVAPPAPMVAEPEHATLRRSFWKDLAWPALAMYVYAAGAIGVASWLCLGALAAHRLVRSGAAAPAELAALLDELIESLPALHWLRQWFSLIGLEALAKPVAPSHSKVRLLISDKIDVAVAIGVFRPAILLPKDFALNHSALPLPPSALRPILAHELAHITCRDLHWLAASRLLLILLWPQPLFWPLRRRMRLDQELLADAAAAELTSRQTYAEQLVAWARHLPPRPAPCLSAAVGLWEGPSQLRQRIALLVDEHFTVLRNCSRRYRAAVTILAIASTLILSIVTVEPTRHADAQNVAPVASEAAEPAPAAPSADAIPREIPQPIPNTILGHTTDENGQPIVGAEMFLFRIDLRGSARQQIGQTTTDAAGNFRFDDVIDIAKEFPDGKFPPLDVTGDGFIQTIVRAPGRVTDTRLQPPQQLAQHGDVEMIKMPPAATLRGRITDEDGKPVAGALVSVGHSTRDRWEGAKSARSDADGNYEISDVAPFDIVKHREEQAERRRQMETLRNNKAANTFVAFRAPFITIEHPSFAVKKLDLETIPGAKDVQLEPPAIIEGRVIFADSKKPAPGVPVSAATSRPTTDQPALFILSPSAHYTATVRTDDDGKYQFANLPAGTYDIWAEGDVSRQWKLPAAAGAYDVWAKADGWVNEGMSQLAAVAETTTTVPDLILTKGGLLKIRIVDSKTREPVDLPANSQAVIYVRPMNMATNRQTFPQTLRLGSNGRFEARTLPGKNRIFVSSVDGRGVQRFIGDAGSPVEATAIDGQTVDVDVPVADAKEAQAAQSTPQSSAPTIESPKTTDITGQVLNPDGTPAVGVHVLAHSMVDPDHYEQVDQRTPSKFHRGETDADGRFSLALYGAPNALLWLLPRDSCQQAHLLNERRGDLGTFRLEDGIRLHGRVVTEKGAPVPDVWVNASYLEGPAKRKWSIPVGDAIERSALTDADGRFELGPLPPGICRVVPGDSPAENDLADRRPRPVPAAYYSQQIQLSADAELNDIELRAVEPVTIEARFVDSKENATRGVDVFIFSTMPNGERYVPRRTPDQQGRAQFVVPKGLRDVVLDLPNGPFRIRSAPDQPWSKNTAIYFGQLDRDWREITVIRYQPPVVYVRVVDSSSNRVEGAQVSADYKNVEPAETGYMPTVRARFESQDDGRWRSAYSLLPDEEFTLSVTADGYKPFEETMSLKEGEIKELSVILTKPAGQDSEKEAESPEISGVTPTTVSGRLIDESGKAIRANDKTLVPGDK